MTMLRVVVVAFAFLQAASVRTFSEQMPDVVPDLAGWEQIDGEIETSSATILYRLHVNPERGAVYEVIRYRVQSASGPDSEPPAAEKLVWNERPAGRARARCFERDDAKGTWSEMEPGGSRYLVELGTVMKLMSLHRAVILGRDEP